MKILMIEDDEAIRTGLKYYLEQENFEVIETDNGKDSLKILTDEDISICLLDVNLPDINGFDLFKKLKEIKDIPIIFLTANDLETSIVMGLDMGADDYVTKPFRARELISRIHNALRKKRQGTTNIIHFKNSDIIDTEKLISKLVGIGYTRVPMIDGQGQFAVRGGIIDIFSYTDETPVRIELWDDEIDSIRFFDVESQRSVEKIQTYDVFPATEWILSEDEIDAGFEKVKDEVEKQLVTLGNDKKKKTQPTNYRNLCLFNLNFI